MEEYKPNCMSFENCVERIRMILREYEVDMREKVWTSADSVIKQVVERLKVDRICDGFYKWQLPVYFEKGALVWTTVGAPLKEISNCCHNEGDGFKFIGSGSLIYNSVELNAGDWMFIPRGKTYSFRVGKHGVVMYYVYECCAA